MKITLKETWVFRSEDCLKCRELQGRWSDNKTPWYTNRTYRRTALQISWETNKQKNLWKYKSNLRFNCNLCFLFPLSYLIPGHEVFQLINSWKCLGEKWPEKNWHTQRSKCGTFMRSASRTYRTQLISGEGLVVCNFPSGNPQLYSTFIHWNTNT